MKEEGIKLKKIILEYLDNLSDSDEDIELLENIYTFLYVNKG